MSEVVVTITGPVASGKTFILNKFRQILENENFEVRTWELGVGAEMLQASRKPNSYLQSCKETTKKEDE